MPPERSPAEPRGRLADGQGGDALGRRVRAFAAEAGVDLAKSIAYGSVNQICPESLLCRKAAVRPRRRRRRRRVEQVGAGAWAEDAERKAAHEQTLVGMRPGLLRIGLMGAQHVLHGLRRSAPPAKSRAWTVMDPDQYDPENDRRRGSGRPSSPGHRVMRQHRDPVGGDPVGKTERVKNAFFFGSNFQTGRPVPDKKDNSSQLVKSGASSPVSGSPLYSLFLVARRRHHCGERCIYRRPTRIRIAHYTIMAALTVSCCA